MALSCRLKLHGLIEAITGVPQHRPFKQFERSLDMVVIGAVAIGAWAIVFGWHSENSYFTGFCVGWLARLAIDGFCYIGDSVVVEYRPK